MREYRLVGDNNATRAVAGYEGLVEQLDDYDGDFLEYTWRDFQRSPGFAGLSPREQALSRYTIKRIAEDEAPWTIQSGDDTDNLLAIPSPRFVVPSTMHDAAVLSGLAGWEIVAELEETNKKKIGACALTLNDYVNIAVATSMFGKKLDEGDLSYFLEGDDNVALRQTVGGTSHGDFRAEWARFATGGPVFDPTGKMRAFAPAIAGDVVNAYHSVEVDLAVTMLRYLAAGDLELLGRSKTVILDAINAADMGRSGGNFADFGSVGNTYAGGIFTDDFHKYTAGEVLESFFVMPGNQRSRMEVVSTDDGVILRNVIMSKERPGKYENIGADMVITSDEIPKFIATMAAASAGRTSLAQIYSAVQNAHVLSE